jgi:predicted Rossmann fold nucleotide-binding protein DprA/Smf involved in DNA uptake
LTADVLSVMLLHLELDGRVASLPGGRYQQLPDG